MYMNYFNFELKFNSVQSADRREAAAHVQDDRAAAAADAVCTVQPHVT